MIEKHIYLKKTAFSMGAILILKKSMIFDSEGPF